MNIRKVLTKSINLTRETWLIGQRVISVVNDIYKVKTKADKDRFEVFINGDEKPIIMATDNEYKTGSIGFKAYEALATIDNVKISASQSDVYI